MLIIFLLLNSIVWMKTDATDVVLDYYLTGNLPVDFSNIPNTSQKCRQDSKNFLNSLKDFELWALKMYDASAKLTSAGFLTGNVNQLGNYDECSDVLEPSGNFHGKYCLTSIDIKILGNQSNWENIRDLVLSNEPFKGQLHDATHLIPKLSIVQWAICVPSSCSNEDVRLYLQTKLDETSKHLPIKFTVDVQRDLCQVRNDDWYQKMNFGSQISIGIFALILLIVILSTLYEYNDLGKNEWLSAFSLIKNVKEFLSLRNDENNLKVIHGLRFFSAVLIAVCHKSWTSFYEPYLNRNDAADYASRAWTVLIRCSIFHTETFLLLSGLLSSYSFSGRLMKNKKINIIEEYVGRYLRIFPSIGALMLFTANILPLLGNGPQFPSLINKSAELCQKNWWQNIFFLQNYVSFKDSCLFNTYHVAVDFQLFLIVPLISTIIWKWQKKGVIFVMVLIILSAISRAIVIYILQLDVYISYGVSVNEIIAIGDNFYVYPHYRFLSYGIGILVGHFLRSKKDFKLTEMQSKIGWALCPLLLTLSFLGPSLDRGINRDAKVLSFHGSVAPTTWTLLISWIIIASEKQSGSKNLLIRFLEWKGFLILGRLSYSIYLTQFLVFYFNIGITRTSQYYHIISTNINLGEQLAVTIASIILMLFIEFPFINMKKIMFNNKK